MPTKKRMPTNRDEAVLRDLGLSFPETTEDFPWDHRALKVRGKAFVFMGTGAEAGADHDEFFLSCKLPHSAAMALTLANVSPTGYGLGKAGWVSARFPPGKAPLDMLKDWLRESYCAIAPKKLAAMLDDSRSPSPSPSPKKTKRSSEKKATPSKKAAPSKKKKTAKRPSRSAS
jgi:predicted DNA-binding protein (MmcQ/YjbR family)